MSLTYQLDKSSLFTVHNTTTLFSTKRMRTMTISGEHCRDLLSNKTQNDIYLGLAVRYSIYFDPTGVTISMCLA